MANTFNDYKSRISIMQVLKELGYAYDPSKGKTQPSFILKDIHGNETDRVYIKNPTNNDKAYWWRRTGGVDREYGDVVQLVPKAKRRPSPSTSVVTNGHWAVSKRR